jgi:CheY-like chemotaxis protein
MSIRRALIVDDSKPARVVLSRMLEQHSLDVDAVESAEQALEYLTHHRPDVIFMDHLMPGMDGFQAVQAIKNNPRTATIPIMMYTSQEGDLYVGQARALGAMGVLPKQLKPVDVSKVLYQLNLMPERHEAEVPRVTEARPPAVVVVAAEAVPSHATSQYATAHGRSDASSSRPVATDLRAQVESLIKEQTTELRRFVIASLDSYASRVVSDLRGAPGATSDAVSEPAVQPRSALLFGAIGAGVAAIALGGLAAWFGLSLAHVREQYTSTLAQTEKLEQSNAQLSTALSHLSDTVARRGASVSDVPSIVPLPQSVPDVAANASGSIAIDTIPYGEVPLSGQRIESVRALLSQLEAQSFRGTLRVEVYGGRFCLVGNPTEGFSVAPDELSYAKCELVGNPALDNMGSSQRQSLAFGNMSAEAEKQNGGAIKISVVAGSGEHLAVPYPNSASDGLTAGQWNRAAMANNRIEITAVAGN